MQTRDRVAVLVDIQAKRLARLGDKLAEVERAQAECDRQWNQFQQAFAASEFNRNSGEIKLRMPPQIEAHKTR